MSLPLRPALQAGMNNQSWCGNATLPWWCIGTRKLELGRRSCQPCRLCSKRNILPAPYQQAFRAGTRPWCPPMPQPRTTLQQCVCRESQGWGMLSNVFWVSSAAMGGNHYPLNRPLHASVNCHGKPLYITFQSPTKIYKSMQNPHHAIF